jgi:hypothetical protein
LQVNGRESPVCCIGDYDQSLRFDSSRPQLRRYLIEYFWIVYRRRHRIRLAVRDFA